MENLEIVEQFATLDPVQFQDIIEKLDSVIEYQEYLTNIEIVVLCFVSVACGILLGNIFSRYFRGQLMETFLSLNQLYEYGVGLTLSGFALSMIPMIIGATIDGIIKIFKKA